MNENETNKHQSDSHKKSFRLRYIISAVILFLMIAALVFILFTQKHKADPESEKVIREAVVVDISNNFFMKDPNELTDEDFAKITNIWISDNELSDIKLLEKFTNLETLELDEVVPPKNEIPKWMEILAKLGIYDLDKRFAIDLSPLKKLNNLNHLILGGKAVKNIQPLASLINLEVLNIPGAPVSDLKPLKNLRNLRYLSIQYTRVSDIKPLTNLPNLTYLMINRSPVTNLELLKEIKNLQTLCLWQMQITDLEFVKGLTNLEIFEINDLPVSNLEPVKSLKNLQYLRLLYCRNITIEQVEDLQKALPNLEIARE
jgi:hypothetical protein